MQRVLVISSTQVPLMPCHPARARELLASGKAAVFRRYPFAIILTERETGDVQPTALKIDPGAKTTGLALVADFKRGKRVVWAGELTHRGKQIKAALDSRRSLRRGRRSRNLRYRPARFLNRSTPKGWLPPSLLSRVYNVMTWTRRLNRFTPIDSLSMELVRFDTQAMQNPEISGVEYQQGELMGYEVREYLLEKWGRKCAYCGAKDVPLEVEHITPKSRGGSNRVSNLTLACNKCNLDKGNKTAAEYGHPEIQGKAKQPLRDAAAVNATRWTLYHQLQMTGLNVEASTGGRTKFNRTRQGYSKAHWIDAACVGESGEQVYLTADHRPLAIKAMGRGLRQICQTDKYGFPKQYRKRAKVWFGFMTGDIVRAAIPSGKYAGRYVGRVSVRSTPAFNIGDVRAHPKYLIRLHRSDGYGYSQKHAVMV